MSKYTEPGTKVLVVTSAQPLEGKTIVAANLAMALAYGGARVLLIDADMRRPGLHRPLRLTNERGLSQVLNGQARVRDVIQRTVDPNLLAITAGRTPPNPSELLSSERMKTLLANLAHGAFDWILIDTPPVLAVTDAVILAPSVAGVVYVIGAEMTRRRLAERALATILVGQSPFGLRRAEQGRFLPQQVLLFPVLRPPAQELLLERSSLGALDRPGRSSLSRVDALCVRRRLSLDHPAARRRGDSARLSSFARRSPGLASGCSMRRSSRACSSSRCSCCRLPPGLRLALSPHVGILDRALWVGAPSDPQNGPAGPLSIDVAATRVALALAVAFVCLFWSAREMVARGGVRTVSRGIAWTGLALAAVTLAQHATAPTRLYWSFPTVFGAPFGPYRNRNDFATWLIMAIPATVGYSRRGSSRGGPTADIPSHSRQSSMRTPSGSPDRSV